VRGGLGRRLLAGVALVHEGDLDALAGGGLNRGGELRGLGAVLLVRRRRMRRQEVAQRVDGHVQLRALPSLGAVPARAMPALGRGLQRAAVQDRRRRAAPPASEAG